MKISPFFEEDQLSDGEEREIDVGVVEKLESQVKEDLKHLGNGLRKVPRPRSISIVYPYSDYIRLFRRSKTRQMLRTRWGARQRRTAAARGEVKRQAARMVSRGWGYDDIRSVGG